MSKKRVQPAPRQPAPPVPDRLLVYATLPLRYFLGVTFLYAGLQKISDPGFLDPGSTTYIGTQLAGFATRSPIAFLINVFALPTPQLTGIAVIVTELAVGVLVIAGVATRWAAAVGALVNLVFFLTASWTVQPYFLGSDSIYTVAWITLALVGDQGVLTARPLIFGPPAPAPAGRRTATDMNRRRLLLQLGGGAVAAIWVLGILPRARLAASNAGTVTQPSPSPTPPATPGASPTAAATPSGTRIGTLTSLRSQGYLDFQDPSSGDPGIAVSLPGGSVVAFDAVCTHAGCPVAYDSTTKLLACPCHGAQFDPSHGAEVVAGPAPTPLASINVQVGSDGGVYVV